MAQNVHLPSGTKVFVPTSYQDKVFGGRPVIKMELESTKDICQYSDSSKGSLTKLYVMIASGSSIFIILICICFSKRNIRKDASGTSTVLLPIQ